MTLSSAQQKHTLFEPVALILLSLATVGTAWCSFQAATWSGASQRLMNQSAAASRVSVSEHLQASQLALLDVMLFSQYINARANKNIEVAKFYADRFRDEAKAAFDAWLAARPFENPSAPAHPFVHELYKPRLLSESEDAAVQSLRLWQEASVAGSTGRGYVLITVLLASALFCGGTAAKFDTQAMRHSVLALGLAAFAFAVIRMFLLPAQF